MSNNKEMNPFIKYSLIAILSFVALGVLYEIYNVFDPPVARETREIFKDLEKD